MNNISIEKITFKVNNRKLELSFENGLVMMPSNNEEADKARSDLSINEYNTLKEEALKLFLRRFGDNI